MNRTKNYVLLCGLLLLPAVFFGKSDTTFVFALPEGPGEHDMVMVSVSNGFLGEGVEDYKVKSFPHRCGQEDWTDESGMGILYIQCPEDSIRINLKNEGWEVVFETLPLTVKNPQYQDRGVVLLKLVACPSGECDGAEKTLASLKQMLREPQQKLENEIDAQLERFALDNGDLLKNRRNAIQGSLREKLSAELEAGRKKLYQDLKPIQKRKASVKFFGEKLRKSLQVVHRPDPSWKRIERHIRKGELSTAGIRVQTYLNSEAFNQMSFQGKATYLGLGAFLSLASENAYLNQVIEEKALLHGFGDQSTTIAKGDLTITPQGIVPKAGNSIPLQGNFSVSATLRAMGFVPFQKAKTTFFKRGPVSWPNLAEVDSFLVNSPWLEWEGKYFLTNNLSLGAAFGFHRSRLSDWANAKSAIRHNFFSLVFDFHACIYSTRKTDGWLGLNLVTSMGAGIRSNRFNSSALNEFIGSSNTPFLPPSSMHLRLGFELESVWDKFSIAVGPNAEYSQYLNGTSTWENPNGNPESFLEFATSSFAFTFSWFLRPKSHSAHSN